MLDIGWSELLVVAIVAIVVVGPKELPKLMRTFGFYAGKLRRAASDFQRQFDEAMAESEVDLVSERIAPVETPPDARIVQAALAAAGQAVPRAFGGVSDLFHVRAAPGIVLGPGRSEQSHAADEWIEVEQLTKGVDVYVAAIEGYFDKGAA